MNKYSTTDIQRYTSQHEKKTKLKQETTSIEGYYKDTTRHVNPTTVYKDPTTLYEEATTILQRSYNDPRSYNTLQRSYNIAQIYNYRPPPILEPTSRYNDPTTLHNHSPPLLQVYQQTPTYAHSITEHSNN